MSEQKKNEENSKPTKPKNLKCHQDRNTTATAECSYNDGETPLLQLPSRKETERAKKKNTDKHFSNDDERHEETLVSKRKGIDDLERERSVAEEDTREEDSEEECQGAVGGDVINSTTQAFEKKCYVQNKYEGKHDKYGEEESHSNYQQSEQSKLYEGNMYENYLTGHIRQIGKEQRRLVRSPPLSPQASLESSYWTTDLSVSPTDNLPSRRHQHNEDMRMPTAVENYISGTIIQMGRRLEHGLGMAEQFYNNDFGLTRDYTENQRKSPGLGTGRQAANTHEYPCDLPKPSFYDKPARSSSTEQSGTTAEYGNSHSDLSELTNHGGISDDVWNREFNRLPAEYRNIFMSLMSDRMAGRIQHIVEIIPTDPPLELHEHAPTPRSGAENESWDIFESLVQDMIEESRIYLRRESENIGVPFEEKVLDTVLNLFNALLRKAYCELTRRQC